MNNNKLMLNGARINILYEASRSKDATRVADILTQKGAITHLITIEENPINRKYYGRLYHFTQNKSAVKSVNRIVEALRNIDSFIPQFSRQKNREGTDYSVWLVESCVKPALEDIKPSMPQELKDDANLFFHERTIQEPIQDKGTVNELPRSKLRGIEKQQGSYTPMQASRNSLIKKSNANRKDLLIRKPRSTKTKKKRARERDKRLKELYDQREKKIKELEKEGIVFSPYNPPPSTTLHRKKKNVPIDLPEMVTCSACGERLHLRAISGRQRELKSEVIGIMIDRSGIVLPKVRNTETLVGCCPFCSNKVTFTKIESHLV